jgi:hypothetical protein
MKFDHASYFCSTCPARYPEPRAPSIGGMTGHLPIYQSASDIPGPGLYEVTRPRSAGGARTSSSVFKSTVKRFSAKATKAAAQMPGPGQYELPGAIQLQKAPPPKFQGFGSRAKRIKVGEDGNDPDPGPGAYVLPSSMKVGRATTANGGQKPSFASTSKRYAVWTPQIG